MKWSCLPVSIFSEITSGAMSVADWASAARDMGLDALDLSILLVPARTPTALKKIRQQLQGMPVAMITTYPDLTQPDPLRRERELANALSDIAVAAELGAASIRLTAGQMYAGIDEDETVKQVAECLAICSERAQHWGVQALLENHSKPGAWEFEDFDFNTRRFLKLVEATKGTPLKINFDTANTYALGDDSAETFLQVYDRTYSIHVNDLACAEPLTFAGIGLGTAPIREIFTIAKQKGFDGLLSIEEAGFHGLDGIRASFEASKQLWMEA